MTAQLADATLFYTDVGRGTPLVCLHGGMGIDGATLRVPGLLRLGDRGVRVIVPDQRGHGRSDRSDEAHYTHDTWVHDVRDLIACADLGRVALLGHSYGGFLALEYAVRWPESLTHLILIGTSAGPLATAAAAVTSDDELRDRFREAWPHFFSGADKHWPLFATLRFSADAYTAAFVRELPRYDLREQLEALRMPVLLVAGADDWYCPQMEWLANRLPHATLAVFEGVGHLPFVEAEDRFVETVSAFLQQ